jgi:hypothetical protein
MLPLVILAMVAFTYLFVRELPSAASASSTTEDGTDTTGAGPATTSTPGEGATTTAPVVVDPAAQEYIDSLGSFQTSLVDLQGQLGAANTAWDADPRTITFDQAWWENCKPSFHPRLWPMPIPPLLLPPSRPPMRPTLLLPASGPRRRTPAKRGGRRSRTLTPRWLPSPMR